MLNNYDFFKDESHGGYQIRTKTDVFSLNFQDDEKEEIFLNISNKLKSNSSISYKSLYSLLIRKAPDQKVLDVLQLLNENELLPREYNCEFDSNVGQSIFIPKAPNISLVIISSKSFGEKFKKNSDLVGYKSIQYFEFNDKFNIEKVVCKNDFFIVETSCWTPHVLKELNKALLRENKPWLFVGGVEISQVTYGPYFFGKHTGCYDCLISRLKSNDVNGSYLHEYEKSLLEQKKVGKADIIYNKDLYENLLVSLVLLECNRIIESFSIPTTWRTKINIDLFTNESIHHTLLKKPYCETCKPELEYNSAPWLEAITLSKE